MITLKIIDETAGGKVLNEVEVSFQNELTTVQDIINTRVYAEVAAYNNKMPEYYRGLIQPGATLNGFKLKQRKKIDAEQQLFTALEAFGRNGFFVLIDNIQAEISINSSSKQNNEVLFLHRRKWRSRVN